MKKTLAKRVKFVANPSVIERLIKALAGEHSIGFTSNRGRTFVSIPKSNRTGLRIASSHFEKLTRKAGWPR